MKILTSVVNNPTFIEMQYHTLKKHMKCEYEFIVFNDAKPFPDFTNYNDPIICEKIYNMCEKYKIKCISIPNLHHKFMDCPVVRCADAMNFMFKYMKENLDEYLIIDSDMFLIDDLTMDRYRSYDCAIVLQHRKYVNSATNGRFAEPSGTSGSNLDRSKIGLEHSGIVGVPKELNPIDPGATDFDLLHGDNDINYIWNGLFYFNLYKMGSLHEICWDKILKADVGGMTHQWLNNKCANLPNVLDIRNSDENIFNRDGIYFIKHLWSLTWNETEMPYKLLNTSLEKFMVEDPRNKNGNYYCEIYDNIFLHYRAGGDWERKGENFHNSHTEKLKGVIMPTNNESDFSSRAEVEDRSSLSNADRSSLSNSAEDIRSTMTLLEIERDSKDKFRKIFGLIYEHSIWGENSIDNCKGGSGDGSNLSYNLTTYVPFVTSFIKGHQITSVADLGCGDFLCGPYIYNDLDIEYIGYDTYPKVIEQNHSIHNFSSRSEVADRSSMDKYSFVHLDIFNEWSQIKSADLCILKDVLQHWRTSDIYTFLDAIILSKKFKYILICNCCDQEANNVDLYVTGGFRKLSADFFPLARYDPIILYKYCTKEVSLIICH